MHGPEVCYVNNGTNGVLTKSTAVDYSDAVLKALSDPEFLKQLGDNAQRDSEKYTLDAMADNFATGIRKALSINE